MFNNDWIENQRGQMEVITHRSDTVAAALKYMYTGSTTGISLISVDVLGLASEVTFGIWKIFRIILKFVYIEFQVVAERTERNSYS